MTVADHRFTGLPTAFRIGLVTASGIADSHRAVILLHSPGKHGFLLCHTGGTENFDTGDLTEVANVENTVMGSAVLANQTGPVNSQYTWSLSSAISCMI
jgi:hypothetical protein